MTKALKASIGPLTHLINIHEAKTWLPSSQARHGEKVASSGWKLLLPTTERIVRPWKGQRSNSFTAYCNYSASFIKIMIQSALLRIQWSMEPFRAKSRSTSAGWKLDGDEKGEDCSEDERFSGWMFETHVLNVSRVLTIAKSVGTCDSFDSVFIVCMSVCLLPLPRIRWFGAKYQQVSSEIPATRNKLHNSIAIRVMLTVSNYFKISMEKNL